MPSSLTARHIRPWVMPLTHIEAMYAAVEHGTGGVAVLQAADLIGQARVSVAIDSVGRITARGYPPLIRGIGGYRLWRYSPYVTTT